MGALETLRAAGIHIEARGGTLHAGPREALTDDIRDLIRRHKPDLLAHLTAAPSLTPADMEAIEERVAERAAIMEHDGGLPRVVAEQEARTAMRVFRVRVAMGSGEPDRDVVMLAPNCDLAEARRSAELQFGAERVLSVIEQGVMP